MLFSFVKNADPYTAKRMAMVEAQIVRRGITAEPVLAAMRKVPRHDFVPEDAKDHAYEDRPLLIGACQRSWQDRAFP